MNSSKTTHLISGGQLIKIKSQHQKCENSDYKGCSSTKQKTNAGSDQQSVSAPANDNSSGYNRRHITPVSFAKPVRKSNWGSYLLQLPNLSPVSKFKSEPIGHLTEVKGDTVYSIAWKTSGKVMKDRLSGPPEPVKPKPSSLRLAFPPST